METLILTGLLSLAVAAASSTLTRAVVFRPLRLWLKGRSKFFHELFICPYCMSHWLAALAVLVFQPRLTGAWIGFDLVLAVFVIVATATVLMGFMFAAVKQWPPPRPDEAAVP